MCGSRTYKTVVLFMNVVCNILMNVNRERAHVKSAWRSGLEREKGHASTEWSRAHARSTYKERSLIFSIYILIIVSRILFVVVDRDLFIYF